MSLDNLADTQRAWDNRCRIFPGRTLVVSVWHHEYEAGVDSVIEGTNKTEDGFPGWRGFRSDEQMGQPRPVRNGRVGSAHYTVLRCWQQRQCQEEMAPEYMADTRLYQKHGTDSSNSLPVGPSQITPEDCTLSGRNEASH